MYFSIIISMVKYLYRLENNSDGLLTEAYVLDTDLPKGTVTRDRTITESHDLWEILRI